MKEDLVSIIMPVYNCEKYIKEAVDSVLNQNYDNWELIIVDDLSDDNSACIIDTYVSKDSRIKSIWFSENKGAAEARNKAIESSKGRYLAFLDCDDKWKENKLNSQIDYMKEKKIGFSFTNYELISDKGKKLNRVVSGPETLDYKEMLKGNSIGCLTVVIDKNEIKDFKMPLLRKGQDYAAWLKVLKNGHKAYRLNENLAEYRIRSNSLSRSISSSLKRTWNIYYNFEKLGFSKSVYYFIIYAYRAYKKRGKWLN